MKINPKIIMAGALVLALTINVFAQTNIAFTSVNAEPDNSIQLHWTSNTNEYYEIDCANALATNSDGTTAWSMIYDDYPSQGTNTFWLDAGNFFTTPIIPHPKYSSMRFYRIVVEGTNTTGDGLSVAITSLTNGAVVSGNVTVQVSASSSNLLSKPILYLDGKEMNPSLDGTNYVINTCESWNGSHTLFAVAKSQSGLEGNKYNLGITYDRAVSPMVNVTFENLITDLAFSQEFFQPSLGQTQQVSASFTANCNWTLQILDSNSNAVRTVTGSGNSMAFNWDGTGDGGTNIPDAVYTYLLSAETNGEADEIVGGGSGGSGGGSPPSPDFARSSSVSSESSELWAVAPDSEKVVPLALYPPGFDTNDLTIFKATSSEIRSLYSTSSSASGSAHGSGLSGGGYFISNDSGGAGSGQSTSANGAKNALGTIGVCYQRYLNPNIYAGDPPTGWPYPVQPQFVALDGYAASSSSGAVAFGKALQTKSIADGFTTAMQTAGYYSAFEYGDDQVKITDLEKTSLGGNSIFNNVNFGFLITHGSYATNAEDDGVKYTYIWIENLVATSCHYLRLSDFDFGGAQPNGLRWMTILACDTLQQSDYNSMKSHSKIPANSNLHLLLSASSVIYFAPDIGNNYANNLTFGQQHIIDAWYNAGSQTYSYQNKSVTNNVSFAYTGDGNCLNDTLQSYQSPGAGLQYNQTTIYTIP
jgi:hypothetical protein